MTAGLVLANRLSQGKYADIVVLEGGHNLVALDLIMQRIANHIAEN